MSAATAMPGNMHAPAGFLNPQPKEQPQRVAVADEATTARLVKIAAEKAEEEAKKKEQGLAVAEKSNRNNMVGLQWLRDFMARLHKLVQWTLAKLGLRGNVSVEPGTEAPDVTPSDAAAVGAAALDSNAEHDPAADAAQFADAAQDAEAAALATPGSTIVVKVDCLPEQLQEVRDALFASLKPLFDNPDVQVDASWPTKKVLIAAETLGEQAERMRYAHRITTREIMVLAQEAITRNPSAYAGLSPASLVETLRHHQDGNAVGNGTFESRIIQQIQKQTTIQEGYDAYLQNALSLMDTADNPIAQRAIKQTIMSAATDTRVKFEQLEKRLLDNADTQARERFNETNLLHVDAFDLPPFTKTLQAITDEGGAPRAAAPSVAHSTVTSQNVGTTKPAVSTGASAVAPETESYLDTYKKQAINPASPENEVLTQKLVDTISAVKAAASVQPTGPQVVSSTPFPARPVANPIAAALARSKTAVVPTPAPAVAVQQPQAVAPVAQHSALKGAAHASLPALAALTPTMANTSVKPVHAALVPDDDDCIDDSEGMVS